MEHPYTPPSKLNEGKRLVEVEGTFLNFTSSNEGAAVDFLHVGLVIIPLPQIDKCIEIDFETKECKFKIPCWLAEDKGISYHECA